MNKNDEICSKYLVKKTANSSNNVPTQKLNQLFRDPSLKQQLLLGQSKQ